MWYLGIGSGFQKAESVAKSFCGKAQFLLLFVNSSSALQNHFIILSKDKNKKQTMLWLFGYRILGCIYKYRTDVKHEREN